MILPFCVILTWIIQWYSAGNWADLEGPEWLHSLHELFQRIQKESRREVSITFILKMTMIFQKWKTTAQSLSRKCPQENSDTDIKGYFIVIKWGLF